jgi:sugar phosphate isomerase/epimerase
MEYGLQLWSIREELEKNYREAILKVGALGYCGVEFAGYGGLSAGEMKALLKEANLAPIGSHTAIETFENSFAQDLAYHKEIGTPYILCPSADLSTPEKVQHLVDVLNEAAALAKGSGIKIGFHNHQHEFKKFDGKYILDIIAENTTDDVLFELDVYWIRYAGEDPFAWIQKLGSRVELIHIKQIGKDNANVEVGEGDIDIKELVAASVYAKHFIVEQEGYDKPVWDTTKNNIDYLKGLGL